MRGLSDEYGSWKITWMPRRMSRISRAPRWVMSVPAKPMVPAVGSSSLSTVRPTVVLPQPDSPTRPSVSPGAIANDDVVDRLHRRPSWKTGRRRPRPEPRNTCAGARPVSSGLPNSSIVPPVLARCAPVAPAPACRRRSRRRGCRRCAWPVVIVRSTTSVSTQASIRKRQRGAKRQPGGGKRRSGGRPSMVSSRIPRGRSSRGTERIRPMV